MLHYFKKTVDAGRNLTKSNRVLIETANQFGVEINKLEGPKRRFKLRYGNKSYLVKRGQIVNSFNHKLATRLCRQKDLTNTYLRNRGFPAPENLTFTEKEFKRAWNWAKDIRPVVLKPVDGSLGKMVYVNITKKSEFKKIFAKITKKHDKVLVEEFKPGSDHRILVVNNKIVGIIRREPANVIGDGKSRVRDLINKKNNKRKGNPVLTQLKLDEEAKHMLSKQGLNPRSKLKKKQIAFLRSNANISDGADSYEVLNDISSDIKEFLEASVKSIPGLHVTGIDAQINESGEVNIIELNGNPMLHIHYFTSCGKGERVAESVVRAMFTDLK